MRIINILLCFLMLGGLLGTAFAASPWRQTEKVITQWQGEKELLLRSSMADPLADPQVQQLIEFFLDQGFAVTPVHLHTTAESGLVLDIRENERGRAFILSRAADGTILALDRLKAAGRESKSKETKEEKNSDPITSSTDGRQTPAENPRDSFPIGFLDIPGHPKFISAQAEGILELVLLTDSSLERYRLKGNSLQKADDFSTPVSAAQALSLNAADVDGDGNAEISAVWAEVVDQIYGGKDAKIHSWILSFEEFQQQSRDLEGYLRLVNGSGLWQGRSAGRAFAGPVLPLIFEGGEIRLENQPVSWGAEALYHFTPLDSETGIAWVGDGRLALVSVETGEKIPGGELSENLGTFRSAEIVVRKKDLEYRSGFERTDRVMETYYPLPRRTVIAGDDTIYTIFRGRSEGLPLIGQAEGRDQVVRISRTAAGLKMEHPFAPVDDYILDFTLLSNDQNPRVVVLLNEEEDGSGKARILIQQE